MGFPNLDSNDRSEFDNPLRTVHLKTPDGLGGIENNKLVDWRADS